MNMLVNVSARLLVLAAFTLPAWADTVSDTPLAVTSSATQFDTPLLTSDTLASSPTPLRATRQHGDNYSAVSPDFWIYDSWVTLYGDDDADGYYSGFSITLDADTVYNAASVYAVIFVGRNDTYESVYTTSIFTLYSDDSQDALTIDSDLVTGFPPRDYHILIELYDADTHQLVAYSDDYDDADLAYLSLESDNFERTYSDTVVVVEKHGGSVSVWQLTALLVLTVSLITWRRRSNHPRQNIDK